jgi:NADH-quinone oxidoreductase subunit N
MMLLSQIETPDVDVAILLPLLFLAVGGLLILTLTSVTKRLPAWAITGWTVAAAAGSIISVLPLWDRVQSPTEGPSATIAGSVGFDGFSLFLTVVIALAVAMASLLSHSYLEREDLPGPELHVLLLLSAAGGVIMAFSNDLLVFFLGLETLSMAVYIMAAMHRRRFESQEAGIKYFVLGSFSSAFLLYGIALLYGATGTTNLVEMNRALNQTFFVQDGMLLGGIALLMVGLAFKVGAVPFHSWTPDVYQGAPTPVVAWMASGVKVAGFAGLLRLLSVALQPMVDDWGPPLQVIAALTLIVGAFSAIVQTDVKRLFAYSSISHAGFILLGVTAASARGTAAALFYLASYTFLVAGTFGVLTVMGGAGDANHSLDSFRGLARRKPVLAVAMLVFLLAQAGVPLTTGFFAKFEVIGAAIDDGAYWLAIIAMLAAVVAAYLYIKVIVTMFLDEADEDAAAIDVPRTAAIVIGVAAVVTLFFGIFPGPIDDLARDALAQLAIGT